MARKTGNSLTRDGQKDYIDTTYIVLYNRDKEVFMGNILSFVSDGAAVSAETLKVVIENNIAATVATIGLVIYFLCTAVVFITNPIKFGKNYSVQPVDNAGKTEIRVYYGGISFALGLFLAVLAFVFGHPFYSLVGGLIFANTVFFTRLTFTFVDKSWSCPYTKLAIPAEGAFIVVLWICFAIAVAVEGAI